MVPVGPPHPSPCPRPDLAARLVEYDELPSAERRALAAHARACPSCGPALRLLEAADAHLAERRDRRAGDACPTPEELFDAAGAPGAEPLAPERAAAVRAHAERCAECGSMVATLAARPPSPLLLDPLADGPADGESVLRLAPPERTTSLRRPRPWARRFAPLAAAAGLLVALAVWRGGEPWAAGPGGVRFPAAELVRGDQGGALLWPRGTLLSPPAADEGLTFELALPGRARHWRVRVFERSDDPFAEGRELLALEGTIPLARTEPLAPGAYTWEAWAEVDGLDVALGRGDFDVRVDAHTSAELARIDTLAEPRRSSEALRLLSERGYHADARAWARSLPPSSERDAFLARTPGR